MENNDNKLLIYTPRVESIGIVPMNITSNNKEYKYPRYISITSDHKTINLYQTTRRISHATTQNSHNNQYNYN